MHCPSDLISIEASCIARIDNMFFLLVEIEIGTTLQVVIIRITPEQANALLNAGIPLCRILNQFPTHTPGVTVTFVCVFVVDDQAFLVFDVEGNTTDELVLVRAPLCPIIGLT